MPTTLFGYDVTVAENGNTNFNSTYSDTFTAVASGTADEIVINVQSTGENINISVWDNNGGGAQDDLLATATISSNVSTGDLTATLNNTIAVTAGQSYRLGIQSGSYMLYGRAASSNFWDQNTTGHPTIPDPWATNGTSSNLKQIRCFVQASGGATTNPGLRFTIRDADSANALIVSESNIEVHVYDTDGGTELYSTATASSDGSGQVEIDDNAVGAVDDSVFVVMIRSGGGEVCGNMTVIDLDA